MTKQAILFDLDGTLVDSVPDLHACVNQALQQLGLAAVPLPVLATWIGEGTDNLIRCALAYVGAPEQQQACLRAFHQAYEACDHSATVPRLGMHSLLQTLQQQGVRLAVITNKPMRFTQALLAAHGMSHYFELVLGGDSLAERKPSALPLQHAMQTLGLTANQCLMVGDSRHDVASANAAKVEVLVIEGGYAQGDDPKAWPAQGWIRELPELLAFLSQRS